jgi:quinolinate synthase
MGLIYRLQQENPGKQFLLLNQGLVCPNMKYTNLEKVVRSLETLQPQITVKDSIREPARRALERMLAVG